MPRSMNRLGESGLILVAIILILAPDKELWGQSAVSALRPVSLRCEYLANPLGIDAVKPRLQWVLESKPGERGRKQTAYQILVATSEAKLRAGQGDLWDSGRIESNQSAQVPYGGKPLPLAPALLVESAGLGRAGAGRRPGANRRIGRWDCWAPAIGKGIGSAVTSARTIPMPSTCAA